MSRNTAPLILLCLAVVVSVLVWSGRVTLDNPHMLTPNGSKRSTDHSPNTVEIPGAHVSRVTVGNGKLEDRVAAPVIETPIALTPTCFQLSERGEFVECMTEALNSINTVDDAASLIANEICTQNSPREFRTLSLELAFKRLGAESSLELSNKINEFCPNNMGKNLMAREVVRLALADESYYSEIRSTLSVESLYGEEGGEVGIAIAGKLARSQDDLDLYAILEEGALGRLSADALLVSESIVQVMASAKSGSELTRLASRILTSPSRPLVDGAKHNAGGHLVHHLLAGRALSLDGASERVGLLLDLCADPYWGQGAAAQVIAYRDRESPPEGIDLATWSQLWDHARLVYSSGNNR